MKMRVWTVIDPDTRSELIHEKLDMQFSVKPDGRNVGNKYENACRAVENRHSFFDLGQAVLARETAEVAMGLSEPVAEAGV